jgi:hypothetical protein
MEALGRSFAVVRVLGSFARRDGVAETIGWDAVKNKPGAESGMAFLLLTSSRPAAVATPGAKTP